MVGKTNGVTSRNCTALPGQVVVVFQGGGALGAYQAGVYQALHEAGIEPDWIIGTSIGAINAGLIAGNEPGNRINALKEFWERVTHKSSIPAWPGFEQVARSFANFDVATNGLPNFFEPNGPAFLSSHVSLGADNAGYYKTLPLAKTLSDLVDFKIVNQKKLRLTVGAAQLRTSMMTYFDSHVCDLDIRHIMASGALPPAFPAVRIDDELYWDGGILSNTPVEAVFDENPRKDSLIFAVHLWNPDGPEPQTMWDVAHRQKDIQYSSKVTNHMSRLQQLHRLRHVVNELAAKLPETVRNNADVKELMAYGCLTRMHVVRLLAPDVTNEDSTKDIDFSPTGIRARWDAGYANTLKAIETAPWQGEFDPLSGIILHDLGLDFRSSELERKSVVVTPQSNQTETLKIVTGTGG